MSEQTPTVLVYGTPDSPDFYKKVIEPGGWGMTLDNGKARDLVFSMYENIARADVIVAFPNAHPVHLLSLVCDAEVGHPLLLKYPPELKKGLETKPIIFAGSETDFAPFKNVFSEMQRQGLIRPGFDKSVTYEASPQKIRKHIEQNLPERIPTTRLHYYVHSQRKADLGIQLAEGRPPSDITVSCFGSASTKQPEHLDRADKAALMIARNGWNILHGGGIYGVMGQLSKSAEGYKAYVIGVTVDPSGAPAIVGVETTGRARPGNIDKYIASKDMLHRIETYGLNAHAFVSLDGGIGSAQEIAVIAELLSKRHPAVMYETTSGELVKKPLWIVNESGIYGPLMRYLSQAGCQYLMKEIGVADSMRELEAGLKQYFLIHQPIRMDPAREKNFRQRYFEMEQPTTPLNLGLEVEAIRTPNLDTLTVAPEPGRKKGHSRRVAGMQR